MSHREDGTPKCSSCERYAPRHATGSCQPVLALGHVIYRLAVTGTKSQTVCSVAHTVTALTWPHPELIGTSIASSLFSNGPCNSERGFWCK